MEDKGIAITLNGLARIVGFLMTTGFVVGLSSAVGRRIANKAMNQTKLLGEAK